MIPLCTTPMCSSQLICGCELMKFGAPCVAQRVCAIPSVPLIGAESTRLSSSEIFPGALRVSSPLPFMIAIPAES